MANFHWTAAASILLIQLIVLVRAILRPGREPASRLAWVIIIIAAPLIGALLYLLLGETRLRRRRLGREIDSRLPRPQGDEAAARALEASGHAAPFALARTINSLGPTGGNRATLSPDSESAIRAMVADVDSATDSVHLVTYIWLDDDSGLKIKEALIRAARRGVAVRALADALGSRSFIRSAHWRELAAAGAEMRIALPVGNLLWTMVRGRIDLRNHRKALIVDNKVAWCGSQNLADAQFRIKPRFAPWVDIMSRWEGPVALHWQYLFVSDWMAEGGSDISECLCEREWPSGGTVAAQVIGTGPTLPYDAMPSCFAELIHSARDELVITTPYFVPDEQLLYALMSAARRGVKTTLVFPKRNDSMFVAAASRSYYAQLIAAGARIFEFRPGLLHAKTMVADGKVGMIGSANLDRRSFELNFESNILFADPEFAMSVRSRQQDYIAQSDPITSAEVDSFGFGTRLRQNFFAMLSPVL